MYQLVNINYKGRMSHADVAKLGFKVGTRPNQVTIKLSSCTLVVFRTGSCRIMGCKQPLTTLDDIPYRVCIDRIQSVTVTANIGTSVILRNLKGVVYEPELFPAARIKKFNPLCVNLFHSGKVVILGLKDLAYHEQVDCILSYIVHYLI